MWNFNPAATFGYLNSLHSKSVCDADRPPLLVPRNPTKGTRTDAATTALSGGGHRTEGHESWDVAREADCPSYGSPGHVSACCPGLLELEACGSGGHLSQQRPRWEQEAGSGLTCSSCNSSSILSGKVLTVEV